MLATVAHKNSFTFIAVLWFIWTASTTVSAKTPEEKTSITKAPVILILGDSLSAAYGIDVDTGWVQLMKNTLAAQYPHKIVNASVSGETAGGGLARLPALLKAHNPSVVILELGGNDGLRGHPLNLMQTQLQKMITQIHTVNAQVLLLGMKIPPNYGKRYTELFEKVFTDLAQQNNLAFVPFFLEGVATNVELMQRDGIHPKAESQQHMMQNVLPALIPLLKNTATTQSKHIH